MTKKSKRPKPYTKMTSEELAEATKEYDRGELPDSESEVMTPDEHAEWTNGKRGTGSAPQRARGGQCPNFV